MPPHLHYSIAEIERETGISRETLRVWERRYAFPAPLRNEQHERMYTSEQLNRLRLIRQLMDNGRQPGKLVVLDEQQLRTMAAGQGGAMMSGTVEELIALLASGKMCELRPRLEELLVHYGLSGFLTDVVAPLNRAVGDAWLSGKIGIHTEHYYSEEIRKILISTQLHLPCVDRRGPRVLLSTMPGEPHGLGLVMVDSLLSLLGAQVLSLGVQTPLAEITRGAIEYRSCIVGISCSEYVSRRTVASQLVRLRKLLPEHITLWAGGGGVGNITLLQGNIRFFTDLNQISAALKSA